MRLGIVIVFPAVALIFSTGCSSASRPCASQAARVAETIKIPMILSYGGLYVEVTLDGIGPLVMRYDTGSPVTYVDPRRADDLGIKGGRLRAEVDGFCLGVRQVELIEYLEADYEAQHVPGGLVHGSIGNDFFSGYSVGLDFRHGLIWLTPAGGPTESIAHPADVEEPVVVPVERPLGYIVVKCSFSEETARDYCLFDTGSPEPDTTEGYWSRIPHPDGRRVPVRTMDWFRKELVGSFQRAEAVRVGDAVSRGVQVLIFESFDVVEAIGELIGRELVGLVGIAMMREHYTVIDLKNDRLLFFRYVGQDHIPRDEFTGFGFVLEGLAGPDPWVDAVVPGSNAAAAGVRRGDVLVEIDRSPWAEAEMAFTPYVSIIAGTPGEERSFLFDRDGKQVLVVLKAEDLLPTAQ